MPESLSAIPSLTSLYIDSLALTGSLPPSWSTLSQLTSITLSGSYSASSGVRLGCTLSSHRTSSVPPFIAAPSGLLPLLLVLNSIPQHALASFPVLLVLHSVPPHPLASFPCLYNR